MKLKFFPWRVLTRRRYEHFCHLEIEKKDLEQKMEFLEKLPETMAGFFLKHAAFSHSQLYQDLFLIHELGGKKGGFFVEIGACDGKLFSNTLLLEQHYGWNGILVEPARCWHEALRKNRKCKISYDFVSGKTGDAIMFCEAPQAEFSSAKKLSAADHHALRRKGGCEYLVSALSLEDLLVKYSAPASLDFLSIDVEGSEYEILRTFPFDRYSFQAIFCEHNYTAQREKIHDLLSSRGYIRKYESFSQFDDWYFLNKQG